MKRCPDNQINASFIDISRIKWLVFYWPAPGRTDGIPERHQRHQFVVYMIMNGTIPLFLFDSHEWRVDTATGKTLKKRNAC